MTPSRQSPIFIWDFASSVRPVCSVADTRPRFRCAGTQSLCQRQRPSVQARKIEFVALGKMSTEDRRDKELIRWFLNELLVIRAAALVGGRSLFMDFGDGLAPPIRI